MARFEPSACIAAMATFALAILAYGLLRRHWRRERLERFDPDRPVGESKWVFVMGVISSSTFALRKWLDGHGWTSGTADAPILGGAILVLALFFLWVSILHAWRISRPLWREPRIWVGFGLAVLPPVLQLAFDLSSWVYPG
jgi:serine/threonine-protein kinase